MGLGKTVSTLTAIDRLYLAGETHPTLILAPKRVARSVWPRESAKWTHLRNVETHPILGTADQRAKALKVQLKRGNTSVFTINYQNLPWLRTQLGGKWPFGTVVSDESTRLKGFRIQQGGVRAHAIGEVAHTKVKRWINLTGTPSPNGLQDLWGQTWFLDAGQRLGRTYSGFVQRWFRTKWDDYGIEPMPFSDQEIHERLKDICLSIDAKDHFDLKEPIVNNVYVDLMPQARRLYKEMEKDLFIQIESHDVEAFNAAAKTNKLLQLANGAVYVDDKGSWKQVHDEKLEALESIVEEAAGMPLFVAYNFVSDLARLKAWFPQARELKTKQDEDDWNAGKIPMLLAHPASAGHGLDLQDGGNILVYFGLDWNLEYRQQILERIGPVRQMQAGHDRPVFVYNILARGTVDEWVLERVESKRSVQDLLLEAMKRSK